MTSTRDVTETKSTFSTFFSPKSRPNKKIFTDGEKCFEALLSIDFKVNASSSRLCNMERKEFIELTNAYAKMISLQEKIQKDLNTLVELIKNIENYENKKSTQDSGWNEEASKTKQRACAVRKKGYALLIKEECGYLPFLKEALIIYPDLRVFKMTADNYFVSQTKNLTKRAQEVVMGAKLQGLANVLSERIKLISHLEFKI